MKVEIRPITTTPAFQPYDIVLHIETALDDSAARAHVDERRNQASVTACALRAALEAK